MNKALLMEHPLENTRVKSRAKAFYVTACVLVAALALSNFLQAGRVDRLTNRVQALYQKSFFETCELMEGLSSNLQKLLVTSSPAQEQLLLNEVARQAQGVQDNLAALPMAEEHVTGAMKFVNQVGDFANALSSRIAAGSEATEADFILISTLSAASQDFSLRLNALMERFNAGEPLFAIDGGTVQADLPSISEPAGAYPVLLYDGPFSDGASTGSFRALESLAPISAEEAQSLLSAFIGIDSVRDVRLEQESAIPVETYEFSLTANGRSMEAAVTKRGGRILYLLSNEPVGRASLTSEEAVAAAKAFLLSHGFGEMEPSYFSVFGGILTANFAPVENSVILYPDLVKLQVSLADGEIVGAEFGNYLRNHAPRSLPAPVLSAEDALQLINPRLTASSARLCLVPVGTQEVLCYEVLAEASSGEYLLYIDALTGAEREIMQVVSSPTGVLVR